MASSVSVTQPQAVVKAVERSGAKKLGRMKVAEGNEVDCDCEGAITKRNF